MRMRGRNAALAVYTYSGIRVGDLMLSRRNFLKTGLTTGAAALPLASVLDAAQQPADHEAATPTPTSGISTRCLPARLPQAEVAAEPWQQRVRRVGQTNMTEHDPAVMNVEEWADYWHASKVDVVYVSVTGILAFYPSKVPFHRHGKFLNGRDFFGECAAAAKKRGMRVVARMSPDLNWPDALAAHPEWAMRHKDGSPLLSAEDPRLFKTCMFSTYMDDYVPAIMREINSLYDVDCFYTNGWPPLGNLPECSCAICSKLPGERHAGLLARLYRARAGVVEALRRDREGKEARKLFLCQLRRQCARRTESRSARQNHLLVPGR